MIQALQWLENLEVLNISGNKFQEPDYDKQLVAWVKNLKYINYEYIDDNMRNAQKDSKFRVENNEDDGKESNKKKEEEIEREFERLGIDTLYKYEDKLLMDENGSEATDLHALLELPEIYETSY